MVVSPESSSRFLHWLMQRLCNWGKLSPEQAADCERLANDPAIRLSEGAIVVPSIGFRLYLTYLIPALGFAPLIIVLHQRGGIWTSIACVAGSIVTLGYLIAPAVLMRRTLKLDATGFSILQGDSNTFVPWICIIAGRDWDTSGLARRIPVYTWFKNAVSTNDGFETRTIASGGKLRGIRMSSSTEIRILWTYQIDPELFCEIARRMSAYLNERISNQSPDQAAANPVPEWLKEQSDQLPEGMIVLKNGGLQVPASAVVFPSICCSCGVETNQVHNVGISVVSAWYFPIPRKSTLSMPACHKCWSDSQNRCWGSVLLVQFALSLAMPMLILNTIFVEPIIVAVCALPSALFTYWVFRLLPPFWSVAQAVYNSVSNEYRFRFRNAEFQEQMIEAIRERD